MDLSHEGDCIMYTIDPNIILPTTRHCSHRIRRDWIPVKYLREIKTYFYYLLLVYQVIINVNCQQFFFIDNSTDLNFWRRSRLRTLKEPCTKSPDTVTLIGSKCVFLKRKRKKLKQCVQTFEELATSIMTFSSCTY